MVELTQDWESYRTHLQGLSADQVLDHITQVRQIKKNFETQDAVLLDRLDELVEAGELDPGGFTHNDHSFTWSAGKKSWTYPVEVQELEEQTKAAKAAAQANNTATATTGSPFWTIRAPKP